MRRLKHLHLIAIYRPQTIRLPVGGWAVGVRFPATLGSGPISVLAVGKIRGMVTDISRDMSDHD